MWKPTFYGWLVIVCFLWLVVLALSRFFRMIDSWEPY